MTLGEFRDKTEHLDEETEILCSSSYGDSKKMQISDLEEVGFYEDEDIDMPIVVLLFNDEED